MPQETSSELDPDDSDAELFVEVDPTGRYGRYKEILGKGAFKKVYRAFDEWEGIEVAWNQVKVSEIVRSSDDLERLYSEVNLLKTLKHKNIIKFYNSWVDTIHEHINFITEIFTSGTLRQYRKKHKRVDLRALKKWSRQILEGLHYLHVNDPPIIHRDLKCDNIFVNGNHGEVKIGDLGFAGILRHANAAHSVIGTPEFMAPELYEEEYNELVDIYAFGMCMLELVTFEYPYSECSNAAQIYKKVTSGIKPASLAKVSEPSVKVFIEKCIADVSDRMSARELLRDPFLSSDRDQEGSNHSLHIVHLPLDVVPVQSNRDPRSRVSQPEALEQRRDYRMLSERKDLNTIFIKLKITDSAGQNRNIHFPFDLEADTSIAVASEMVHELDLTDQDVTTVADMIDSEIRSHIPDWSPRESSVDESLLDSYTSDSRYTASPITNASAYSSASLVLEQLSSGRKVWSNSPKAAGGNSSLKLHPFSASHFEVCVVEESNQNSSSTVDVHDNEDACSHEFPNNTTANGQHLGGPEDQLNEVVLQSNPQVSFDKHSVVDPKERGIEIVSKSRFTVDDVYLNNEAEDDQKDVLIDTRNKTVNSGEDVGMYEGNASEVRTFVEKLEQLLVEQQREMDMLKVKHGMIVLNLLNELSPQIRDEVFELCKHRIPCHEISASQMTNLVRNDTEAGSSIISLAKSPTDIDLAISVKAIQLSKVKEPATGADRLVIGPIFRDRLNSLKRNNNSDAGIAVILRDESEKSG